MRTHVLCGALGSGPPSLVGPDQWRTPFSRASEGPLSQDFVLYAAVTTPVFHVTP